DVTQSSPITGGFGTSVKRVDVADNAHDTPTGSPAVGPTATPVRPVRAGIPLSDTRARGGFQDSTFMGSSQRIPRILHLPVGKGSGFGTESFVRTEDRSIRYGHTGRLLRR